MEESNFRKIQKLLISEIGLRKPIQSSLAKEIIKEIYSKLDINKTATAQTIDDFIQIKTITKKDSNNKSIKYIELIAERIIYKGDIN